MRRIVVVGAGLAGLRAVEALRKEGFDGAITLVGAEEVGPYDRPALSKQVLTGHKDPAGTLYRDAEHFADLQVDLRLGLPATSLDLAARRVGTGDGDLPFDGLVIATGSTPRLPAVADGGFPVHRLRTLEDARLLRNVLPEHRHVVILGAGFLGSEIASSARALGLEVTVVEAAAVPMARVVGTRIGEICAALHRAHGTRLICGAQVVSVAGSGRIGLADGRIIEGDLVIAAIGATPQTRWLAGTGLVGTGLAGADGVACDAYLNAGHPAVYAAGDVARWPNPLFGTSMRTEQWTNAVEQARRATANLLAGPGKGRPYAGSNYFWSDQYGVRIQSAGIADADEVRIVHGSPADFRFLAYYRKGDRLVGAFAMDLPVPLIRSKLLIEARTHWEEALSLVEAGV
ncbi:FAD-dependent oxidoreductase [Nonomuraea sp. MG754425]|uniref:NAD(P)/FAD-dependent oxidoreductase n=1 Tax=Nonomuraea sp. MG754425 TaxID=2570319 RepID=UPI001F3FDB2A|nr:FAD-dependent oxidoreductase [Nonomuraea sp. MG754425]MCF6476403.1 FAD-dependent oxidoreductase [Nonomuraea sp. MG754425]